MKQFHSTIQRKKKRKSGPKSTCRVRRKKIMKRKPSLLIQWIRSLFLPFSWLNSSPKEGQRLCQDQGSTIFIEIKTMIHRQAPPFLPPRGSARRNVPALDQEDTKFRSRRRTVSASASQAEIYSTSRAEQISSTASILTHTPMWENNKLSTVELSSLPSPLEAKLSDSAS